MLPESISLSASHWQRDLGLVRDSLEIGVFAEPAVVGVVKLVFLVHVMPIMNASQIKIRLKKTLVQ